MTQAATSTSSPYTYLPPVPSFELASETITDGHPLPVAQLSKMFGVPGGEDVSPQLSWSGFPPETRSFVVSMYDPQAPTGSGFWHWVVFDLPPDTTSLAKNAGDPKANLLPAGALMVRNDTGSSSYNGPCPPKGDKPHHYNITVFAVDVDKLDADQNATPAVIGFNLHFHTLAKATLTGVWGR